MKRNLITAFLAVLLLWSFLSANSAESRSGSDAWLGVYTQTVDKDLTEAFDLSSDSGAIIKMVAPDSPADKAGLRQGDIILKFGDVKLTGADELLQLVQAQKPGDDVKVDIIRNGKEKQIDVILGSREDLKNSYFKAENLFRKNLNNLPQSYSRTYKFDKSSISDSYIGVGLESLNDQLGEYFGVEDGKGALIVEVMPDSPAEKSGLKAGDVIIAVDGDEVTGPEDIRNAVGDKEKGETIEMTVLRNKERKEMTLEVEETPDDLGILPDNQFFPGFDDAYFTPPRMKGLFKGDFNYNLPDMEQLRDQMEELQNEIKDLQLQLKELREGKK
jgi:S1-C subfamily serine protease